MTKWLTIQKIYSKAHFMLNIRYIYRDVTASEVDGMLEIE